MGTRQLHYRVVRRVWLAPERQFVACQKDSELGWVDIDFFGTEAAAVNCMWLHSCGPEVVAELKPDAETCRLQFTRFGYRRVTDPAAIEYFNQATGLHVPIPGEGVR